MIESGFTSPYWRQTKHVKQGRFETLGPAIEGSYVISSMGTVSRQSEKRRSIQGETVIVAFTGTKLAVWSVSTSCARTPLIVQLPAAVPTDTSWFACKASEESPDSAVGDTPSDQNSAIVEQGSLVECAGRGHVGRCGKGPRGRLVKLSARDTASKRAGIGTTHIGITPSDQYRAAGNRVAVCQTRPQPMLPRRRMCRWRGCRVRRWRTCRGHSPHR
jgi:hypothetical protein